MSKCTYVKIVVHFVIFCHLVGGLILLGVGIYRLQDHYLIKSDPCLDIVVAILSILCGTLLLYGAIKKKPTCILVYLVTTTLGLMTLITCYSLVNFGTHLGPVLNLVVILSLFLEWAIHLCLQYWIYLLYKQITDNFDDRINLIENEETSVDIALA